MVNFSGFSALSQRETFLLGVLAGGVATAAAAGAVTKYTTSKENNNTTGSKSKQRSFWWPCASESSATAADNNRNNAAVDRTNLAAAKKAEGRCCGAALESSCCSQLDETSVSSGVCGRKQCTRNAHLAPTRDTTEKVAASVSGFGETSSNRVSSSVDEPSTATSPAFDPAAAEERGEACPGPESSTAGKTAACAGCPNQLACSSGAAAAGVAGSVSAKEEVAKRLQSVKRKVLILSGKGGVGKSTVASQLAWTASCRGFRVGICDVDVCGPSIPLMTSVLNGEVHQSFDGWQPVYVRDNLAVMSIGFLLPEADAAVVWRGPKKNGLIHQFLADVLWGELDILFFDTPPGTSDEHLSLVSLLSAEGAVIVTTPQEAALQDVRKEINFCKKVGVKILGVVENMSDSVFSTLHRDGATKMCRQMEVPYAGSIPLDATLLQACEAGLPAVEEFPEAASSKALQQLVDVLLDALDLPRDLVEEYESKKDHT